MSKEIWKDIQGYEGLYQISNLGRIYSFYYKKIISCSISRGYIRVCLYSNGAKNRFLVHRIVALHFIYNHEKKPFINHINGIKTDNNFTNLEWVTTKENNLHAFKNKLNVIPKGKNNHMFGKTGNLCHSSKVILDTETGVYYNSAKEAANIFGMKYKSFIYHVLYSKKLCKKFIYV
jgi:hypothetical protein